jgi:microcystin-dependent protein
MPVPVLPEEFEPIQWGGSVCDAFKQLIATNERLAQIFEWMFNPDTGEVSDDFIASFYDRMMPIGSVIIWTSSSVPSDKWALCNGQSLNRTTYAALFARIGTQFGSNDATTFKVPNLTNRVPAGAGGDYTLGEEFGVDEVELTELEVPLVSHYHGTGRRAAGAAIDSANNDFEWIMRSWEKTGSYHYNSHQGDSSLGGSGNFADEGTAATTGPIADTTESDTGTAHENRQPSLGVYYLIKIS